MRQAHSLSNSVNANTSRLPLNHRVIALNPTILERTISKIIPRHQLAIDCKERHAGLSPCGYNITFNTPTNFRKILPRLACIIHYQHTLPFSDQYNSVSPNCNFHRLLHRSDSLGHNKGDQSRSRTHLDSHHYFITNFHYNQCRSSTSPPLFSKWTSGPPRPHSQTYHYA